MHKQLIPGHFSASAIGLGTRLHEPGYWTTKYLEHHPLCSSGKYPEVLGATLNITYYACTVLASSLGSPSSVRTIVVMTFDPTSECGRRAWYILARDRVI